MRIDAHQHFWRIARGDYDWLDRRAHRKIYRDYEPADLLPLLERANVERTVLIQAAPTSEETEYLLSLGKATGFIAAVVGWVDLALPAAQEAIEDLSANKLLVGLRPMLQDIPDDEWVLSADLAPAFRTMVRSGLRFDALVGERHLPVLRRFMDLYPDLKVVIDHGAKPQIGSNRLESWARKMREVACGTEAFCKISGLVTEAGESWSIEQLRPYIDVLLESFGPRRLMWGSDWPVLNQVSDYDSWFAASLSLIELLSVADRDAIFGGTAAGFYGISP